MTYQFEGKTEREAIEKAAAELGLESDKFDVEILENQRTGLFKKGLVKIQVTVEEKPGESDEDLDFATALEESFAKKSYAGLSAAPDYSNTEPQSEAETKLLSFLNGVIEHMGYSGQVSIQFREDHSQAGAGKKLGLKIDSPDSSILIGKKGKNLDALQLLANIYMGRVGEHDTRVILDSENYRLRREEALVRLAYTVAERVRETHQSILLEPMNPFDRRLIHTTLNDIADISTKSEGDGLYKQVRIFHKGLR
jgi:spoIIIJ-associated protein